MLLDGAEQVENVGESDVAVTDVSDTAPAAAPTVEDAPGEPVVSQDQYQQAVARIEELEGVRRGLDRSVTNLTRERDKLAEEVKAHQETISTYQDATTGTESNVQTLEQLIEQQRTELAGWNKTAEALLTENARLKIVAGEYPHLAHLVEADALPKADTNEAFRAKLDTLAQHYQAAAQDQTFFRIQHDKPPASPAADVGSGDMESIKKEMDAAREAGDWDEFRKLKDQWHQMGQAQGLSTGGPEYPA